VLIFAALSLTFNAFIIPNYLCKTAAGAVKLNFYKSLHYARPILLFRHWGNKFPPVEVGRARQFLINPVSARRAPRRQQCGPIWMGMPPKTAESPSAPHQLTETDRRQYRDAAHSYLNGGSGRTIPCKRAIPDGHRPPPDADPVRIRARRR
jgi:hypothetical protein